MPKDAERPGAGTVAFLYTVILYMSEEVQVLLHTDFEFVVGCGKDTKRMEWVL